jgi:hypothetical protein
MFAVREHGLTAFEEASNVKRLHRCDRAAREAATESTASETEEHACRVNPLKETLTWNVAS